MTELPLKRRKIENETNRLKYTSMMAEQRYPLVKDNHHPGYEPVFDFYCQFCREDGKMLEAEGYCADCREYLCHTCYIHHRRSRGNRHHVLMGKDKMPKHSPLCLDLVNRDISKKCEHHPAKHVEYYCKTHDSLGCSSCVVKYHRNCSKVDNIPEMAESIMESQEYNKFIQMLKQCDQRSRDNIKLVQENFSKSKSSCLDVAKSLKEFREEINSILDDLERKILRQAENLQKEGEEKLMKVSAKSSESVKKMIEELSYLQKSKKVCEIYIKMKESKKEVIDIHTKLDKAEKENAVKLYVFDPNTDLKKCLQSQHGFGKVSVQGSVSGVGMALPHSNPVNTCVKATYMKGIKVNSSTDREDCIISGSAVVCNNRLLLADHSHNNCKVILISTSSNKVISELKVSSRPWDITVINRNKAAVTLPNSHKILLLKVSVQTLTMDREITVDGMCSGVAYSKNRLVVTYIDSGKLEIMDLSGEVMMRVKNDSDDNMLFSQPSYVCVSNDGETMYVSDYGNDKVISLTFNGVVKSVHSDSDLESPMKVCVDKHGNVFVCCPHSKNVHMLTANLNKIKIILTQEDGLNSEVYSVSHCRDTNRLYVGMLINNKVQVYKLSQ